MIREVLSEVSESGTTENEALASFSPSLVRIGLDAEDLLQGSDTVPGLSGGFEHRSEFIEWEQRLAIRSLGEVPMFVYQGLASQLASPETRPVIQMLLAENQSETAEEMRQRFRSRVVFPAFDRAVRRLRVEATDYGGEGSEGNIHDPLQQRYIAMRPVIDELDRWQNIALRELLQGFGGREAILDWGTTLEYATYGEPISLRGNQSEMPVPEFVQRLHEVSPFTDMVTQGKEYRRAREVLAARFLIPAFNAGVRERLGKSGEIPDAIGAGGLEGSQA